jgi:HD-GYP domain-containing protein (c-di-GMP phosphodiesterase class II)
MEEEKNIDIHMPNNGISLLSQGLICALKFRDENTQLHSERVAGLSLDIGKKCDLSSLEIDTLTIAANLHDIGKIGIADNILLKPGRFNLAEREEMKSHSEKGQLIINNLSFPGQNIVAKVVRHHHENFDGSGYPDNLVGEKIPILSRIISIVDNYDALSEKRTYHGLKRHDEVIGIMKDEAHVKFDPKIFKIFLKVIETSSLKQNF